MSLAPDRITGWVYDAAQPERTVRLSLEIDGTPVDTIDADILRKDLDPSIHPTRQVGFHTTIPFAYWDGEAQDLALVDQDSGEVLIRRKVETR
ncbi:MAG: hypothetical protein EON96_20715, partial [Caulobacteraceae bacterium]